MPYPSDMTDAEWAILEPMLDVPNRFGRRWKHARRAILDAIFYVDRTGCQWRYLPADLPPWQTVYWYSRKWNLDGTMAEIHDALRRRVRREAGREENPSVVVIDSQSVKAAQKGGPAADRSTRSRAGTGTRRQAGASAISSSTRSAC